MNIEWSDPALQSLDNIVNYIRKDSHYFAESFAQNVFKQIELLITQPKLGRIVPEESDEKLRELIFGNYRIIYYLVSEETISIENIVHSRRKFEGS